MPSQTTSERRRSLSPTGNATGCFAVSANLAGNLLAFALLVAPAAAAMSLARGVATALLLAAAIGALSGLLGILLSYHADLPASACIALVATAAVAAAQAVRSSRLLGAGRSL